MIYLWEDEAWKSFESTDADALKRHNIAIGGGARIGDGAYIGGGANIGEGAYIGNGAHIGYGARIGYGANIGGEARIGGGARIGDEARIGNGARIGEGIVPIIIYIIGSRFPVSYWGEDRIDIGCTSKRINDWLNDGERTAEKHGVTPEQINEYRGYVEFIKAQHEASPALDKSIKTEETGVQEEQKYV